MVDFTDPESEAWWRAQAVRTLRLGVEGIKADDGEGYYVGEDLRFADGTTGAQTAWRYGGLYRRSMQRALDEAHGPGRGVLFGRSGWSGQQATGVLWAGDQASDFWSLRTLRVLHDRGGAAAASRTGRTTSAATSATAASSAARRSCCVRWVQLGCFTALMQAHGRLEQEPWTYDRETLALYRGYVLLHEMLNPYVARRRGAARRAAGRRSSAPPRCWTPAAGRSPTRSASARRCGSRRSSRRARASARRGCRRGDWIEAWSGAARARRARGGGARAPARDPGLGARGGDRRHPPRRVRAPGLGEGDAPLHATLWGEPRCGRALARLADGTVVRWRRGRWSANGRRDVTFSER